MRRRNDNSISSICSSSMHPPQQGDCFFPFVVVSLFLRACLCVCVCGPLFFSSLSLSFCPLSVSVCVVWGVCLPLLVLCIIRHLECLCANRHMLVHLLVHGGAGQFMRLNSGVQTVVYLLA